MRKKVAKLPWYRRPLVVLPAVVALLAAILPCTSLVGPHPGGLWRGYQTLLIRDDATADASLASVVGLCGPGVVSDLTASVDFWDFTGISRVSIAGIPSRIDSSDPRYDRFIEGVPGYTRVLAGTRGWHIAYIPSRSMSAVTWLRLSRLLGGSTVGRWRLVDFDPLQVLVALAAFLAFAVMLAQALGGERRTLTGVTLLGALLWLPFILDGGVDRFALALVMLVAWSQIMRVLVLLHGWDERLVGELRQPLMLFCGGGVGGLALLLMAGGASVASALGFLGPAIASLLLLVVLAQLWGRLPRRRRRVSFDPIPIVRPNQQSPRKSIRPALVLALGSIALLLILPLARRVPLPTPSPVLGARDFSWGALQRVSRQSHIQRLPDYADYVTHEAFQEAMAFGRPWLMPEQDERVYVREFVTNPATGSFVERYRRVKVFDTAWLESVKRRAGAGSIGALLLAQGRPVVVAPRGPESPLLRELPVALLVMLAFFGLMGRERGGGLLIRGILLRFNGVARRNQVP
jgi:hypothetical protein